MDMQRRDLLEAIGGVAVVSPFAGCLGDQEVDDPGIDDADDDDDDTDDDDADDEETEAPADREIVDQRIETVNVEAGGPGDGSYTVTADGNVVTIEGSLTGPTPCHVATLESVTYDRDEDELVVTVGTEDDSGPDEVCQQVIATIEYEVQVEFSDGTPDEESVRVEHRGAGSGDGDDDRGY